MVPSSGGQKTTCKESVLCPPPYGLQVSSAGGQAWRPELLHAEQSLWPLFIISCVCMTCADVEGRGQVQKSVLFPPCGFHVTEEHFSHILVASSPGMSNAPCGEPP